MTNQEFFETSFIVFFHSMIYRILIKNNQINPQERYAKIKALYYVNEIFSVIPNNSKTLKKFIETNKEIITDGYKDKDTSFLDNYYNAKIDPTIELAKINLNFKTRYLLGLPVDICDKKNTN